MKPIEWLAGLLEGEGCFTFAHGQSKTTTPLISLAMTDKDIVFQAVQLMTHIGGRGLHIRERELKSKKIVFTTIITGLPAVKIMQAVLPHMGDRRTERINFIIDTWSPKKYKEAKMYKADLLRGGDAAWPSQE